MFSEYVKYQTRAKNTLCTFMMLLLSVTLLISGFAQISTAYAQIDLSQHKLIRAELQGISYQVTLNKTQVDKDGNEIQSDQTWLDGDGNAHLIASSTAAPGQKFSLWKSRCEISELKPIKNCIPDPLTDTQIFNHTVQNGNLQDVIPSNYEDAIFTTDKLGQINVEGLDTANYWYYFREEPPTKPYEFWQLHYLNAELMPDDSVCAELKVGQGCDYVVRDYWFKIQNIANNTGTVVDAYDIIMARDLIVSKKLINANGSALTDAQKDTLFDFSITYTEPNGLATSESFKLKHGESKTWHDLPPETTFIIKETVPGNITSTCENYEGKVLAKDDETSVECVNTVQQMSELQVSKEIWCLGQTSATEPCTLTAEQLAQEFEFEVHIFSDDPKNPYELTQTIKLKRGESKTYPNLKAGWKYTVEEKTFIGPDGTVYIPPKSIYSGTLTEGVLVVNFINKIFSGNEMGDITISKNVVSNRIEMTNHNKLYFFDICIGSGTTMSQFTDLSPLTLKSLLGENYTAKTVALDYSTIDAKWQLYGCGKLALKDGESISFVNLPVLTSPDGANSQVVSYSVDEYDYTDEYIYPNSDCNTQGFVIPGVVIDCENTQNYASISVTKQVINDSPEAIPVSAPSVFDIELQIGDKCSGVWVSQNDYNAQTEDSKKLCEIQYFSLSDGDIYKYIYVPVGAKWQVIEKPYDGFDTDITNAEGVFAVPTDADIINANGEVTVKNSYIKMPMVDLVVVVIFDDSACIWTCTPDLPSASKITVYDQKTMIGRYFMQMSAVHQTTLNECDKTMDNPLGYRCWLYTFHNIPKYMVSNTKAHIWEPAKYIIQQKELVSGSTPTSTKEHWNSHTTHHHSLPECVLDFSPHTDAPEHPECRFAIAPHADNRGNPYKAIIIDRYEEDLNSCDNPDYKASHLDECTAAPPTDKPQPAPNVPTNQPSASQVAQTGLGVGVIMVVLGLLALIWVCVDSAIFSRKRRVTNSVNSQRV